MLALFSKMQVMHFTRLSVLCTGLYIRAVYNSYRLAPRCRYIILQQCNIVNLRMLANCRVCDYTPVKIHIYQKA